MFGFAISEVFWFTCVAWMFIFIGVMVFLVWDPRGRRLERMEKEGKFQSPQFKGWPEGIVPKRKLFLSWESVYLAVRMNSVSEEDLDICLFCSSFSEFNLASEHDREWFDRLHPAFVKAAKEGRFVFNVESHRYNGTTIKEVNDLLENNGVAKLTGELHGNLEMLPNYLTVPRVSDESVQVLWAAHPMRYQWVPWFSASCEEIDDFFKELSGKSKEPLADRLLRMKKEGEAEAGIGNA